MEGGGRSGRVGGVNDLVLWWVGGMVLHSEVLFEHLRGWMEVLDCTSRCVEVTICCLRWRCYE